MKKIASIVRQMPLNGRIASIAPSL